MISAPPSPSKYKNPLIQTLLIDIQQQASLKENSLLKKIRLDRQMYHSHSVKSRRRSALQNRPPFDNKTKEGELLDSDFKPIPYLFVPAYKNDTFIMPNRNFERGEAGKRCNLCTINYNQNERHINLFISEQLAVENEKTLASIIKVKNNNKSSKIGVRQSKSQSIQMFDENDGAKRNKTNKLFFKNRKRFDPIHASQLFSDFDPMLEPKDNQSLEKKKISLHKTYDYHKKWRPSTRGPEIFSSTTSDTFFEQSKYVKSVQ